TCRGAQRATPARASASEDPRTMLPVRPFPIRLCVEVGRALDSDGKIAMLQNMRLRRGSEGRLDGARSPRPGGRRHGPLHRAEPMTPRFRASAAIPHCRLMTLEPENDGETMRMRSGCPLLMTALMTTAVGCDQGGEEPSTGGEAVTL